MYKSVAKTIETHTMGEPTRIIYDGLPTIKGKTMIEKKEYFKNNYDNYRKLLLLEPRGHKNMFGAILTSPCNERADIGVIFIDNDGYLDMCVHGSMGISVALYEKLGIKNEKIILDTPSGIIETNLEIKNNEIEKVSIKNVESFLYKSNQELYLEGFGKINYDICYGGNFFALINVDELNIKIEYKNSKKICDTSGKDVYLSNDVSTGNYGVGMGVLWVSDVYSGKENACDTVKEKIGWNNLEKKFETEYAKNGVQGLYKLYSNGYINYTDGSDKVDVKWFVNQCTCYGIYEHYASSALNSYKTQNQVAIIDLVGVFGDFDWFVAPQLYVTKGSLIGSKFDSGTFTSYNNTWQTYSNEHKLEWTPITEDYYLNSLNCGTTENYWCEEFEKWYGDMKTKYSLTSYPTIATIKKASMSTFNSRYREKLQTMIDAYNLSFYPASGFKWTLENDDSGTNYSYIKNCINANVASCDSIKNFYGSSLTNLSCDRIEKFDFSVYNNQKGTNITGQWYISNCGCDKATSYNCTPNYDLGTCTTGDDIIYSDSSNGIVEDEYWENCVFNDNGTYDIVDHKWADQSESLTYYEDELTNKYCEVYCIEDLNASLAAPNVYVEAGSRFTWGYSSVKGSRTCKTKSVEWSRFKKDLENANDDAVDAYVDYQLEILIKESIENYKVTTSSSSCSCKNNIYYNDKTTVTCCDELAIDPVTNMVKLDSNGKPICKKRNYERYDLYTAEPVEFSVTSKYGDEKHEKWNENYNYSKTKLR